MRSFSSPSPLSPPPRRPSARQPFWLAAGVVVVAVLTLFAAWRIRLDEKPAASSPSRATMPIVVEPRGVMGTSCKMMFLPPAPSSGFVARILRPAGPLRENRVAAHRALSRAELVLRRIEARFSVWLDASELSRLNAAAADRTVPLSAETLALLHLARDAAARTDGAFDATCRPLVELWRAAAARDTLPTDTEIQAARDLSSWDRIALHDDHAVKSNDTTRLDLGGIAKGYAIDRAVETLAGADPSPVGGMVEIGGDLRVFGDSPTGETWTVDIQDPFSPGTLGRMVLRDRAVCTSGAYARCATIAGRRFSHIVDPRTGWPAEAVPSATVVAATAVEADIWATALSVLGPEGLDRLPEGVEALLILGDREAPRLLATPGFPSVVPTASTAENARTSPR